MTYRILQLHIEQRHERQLAELLKDPVIVDYWDVEKSSKRMSYEILTHTSDVQKLIDKVQAFMGEDYAEQAIGIEKESRTRLIVSPVTACWPRSERDQQEEASRQSHGFSGLSREELYSEVSNGTELSLNYMALVFLSTVVAAIGLIENNVAVIIGAMVIAPLLGPNLALALATALGDTKLMIQSTITNITGLVFVVALGAAIGYVWPYGFEAEEIVSRTSVNYDGIVVAIASGAAGVLSLTSGVSSGLVGVMVAVALLPPATVLGLMLGVGDTAAAMGAGLLLAVNIVCVNLAAKVVFVLKGVRPRKWYEQQFARRAIAWYLFIWTATLIALGVLISLGKPLS